MEWYRSIRNTVDNFTGTGDDGRYGFWDFADQKHTPDPHRPGGTLGRWSCYYLLNHVGLGRSGLVRRIQDDKGEV